MGERTRKVSKRRSNERWAANSVLRKKAMKNVRAVLGLAVLLGLATWASAKTPKLTFTFTTVKVKGAQSTAVYGVNNAGVMVGSYVDGTGVRHGFRLASGKVKKIDDPNGTDTYCLGINKKGWIVGWYSTTSHTAQGFLYKGGKYSDVGPANSV